MPVVFFDVLDFFLAQAEVVADLVNQRLADRDDELVVVFSLALVRPLEEHDLIRQHVPVVPAPLGERDALIEAEQCVWRLDVHVAKEFARGLVLDQDDEVRHRVAKAARNAGDRVSDEGFERSAFHAVSQASDEASRTDASGREPTPRWSGSSRSRLSRRTGRRAAWAGRPGVRAESAYPMSASSAP